MGLGHVGEIMKLAKCANHGMAECPKCGTYAVIVQSCNRHRDCAMAEVLYIERTGKKPDVSFHCHDECCEECFGY